VKTILRFWGVLILISAALPMASGQSGSGPSNPAPAGTIIAGIIECGEGYTSHELYDMKITLLEVIRGDEAWKRIEQADKSNKPAQPGMEYLLTRVKYEYYAGEPPVPAFTS